MITHSEKRLEHVASLLTQTENTDFDGCGAFIGTGRAGTLRGMSARERGVESGRAGKYELFLTSARKLVLDLLEVFK